MPHVGGGCGVERKHAGDGRRGPAKVKRACLRCLRFALRRAGRRVLPGAAKMHVCTRMTRYFLDERVLAKETIGVRLAGENVLLPCNPWLFPHRRLYWFGELYEQGLHRFLRTALGRGDTFIDIGCNVGQMTLLAGSLVGRSGRVRIPGGDRLPIR